MFHMYIYAKQKFCRFLTVSRKKRTNHTVQESLLLSNHILLILVRFHKSKQNRQVSSPFPAGSVCLGVFILSERYYTASAYYLSKFGRPVQKAVLDIGCTCPNIDGTISSGGCLFCDGGSGHFTHPGTVTWQLEQERQRIRASVPDAGLIAYFQAHTNTYGDPAYLRLCYLEALEQPDVVGISIGTRSDCLPAEILSLLEEIAEKTSFTVELGLQTVHDKTACFFHRGYDFPVFVQAFSALRKRGIRICVHIINGLPGEMDADMLETARVLGKMQPDGIKIHLLHILKGTPLEQLWKSGKVQPLSMAEYVQITAAQLALLPSETVIERLTGDGAADCLAAPLWSLDKLAVRNAIAQHLKRTDSWQGKYFSK